MNRENKKDLERRLSAHAPVGPPPDLLDRLREDLPDRATVAVAAASPAAAVERRSRPWQRWAAAAAAVFVAVAAGWLARSRWEPTAASPPPRGSQLERAAPQRESAAEPRPAAPGSAPPSPSSASPKPAGNDGDASRRDRRDQPDLGSRLSPPSAPAEADQILAPEPPLEIEEIEGGVEGSVSGGVAGGVPGGVPGGSPGGIPSGEAAGQGEISATAEAPLLDALSAKRRPEAGASAQRGLPSAAPPASVRPPSAPSTGGGAEPNDAPYGDMFFRAAGTNPFVDAEEDPLSTFGLDVDTGSYTLARRYLADGNLPDPDGIRVEEFVNAFRPVDGPEDRSSGNRDFTLRAGGAETPFAASADHRADYRIVRFTIQARPVSARQRQSAVLTFVVDTSGSMDRENRLELVKRALGMLLDELDLSKRGDRVGLVIYDDRARVLLEPTGDREAVRAALSGLRPGGSTNAEEGLALGFEVAGRAFERGAINRVILASDGVANVGATGPESILARIGESARRGIQLTTVGFGMGNYNDALMEQLADQGDGAYAYVDTLDEARRVFRDNLTGTLQTVAHDAKAQVEWNPRVVSRYRLLGYENRDVADRRFRDDSVDAGEIGAGHAVTALYEIKLRPRAELPSGSPRVAILRLRYRHTEERRAVEISEELFLRDIAARWPAASFDLRRAAVAAQFAELLKGSFWAKEDSWDELLREARRLEGDGWHGREGEGERTRELADLIERARSLAPRREPRSGERDER